MTFRNKYQLEKSTFSQNLRYLEKKEKFFSISVFFWDSFCKKLKFIIDKPLREKLKTNMQLQIIDFLISCFENCETDTFQLIVLHFA